VLKIDANHKYEHNVVIIKDSVICMLSVYLTLI